MNNITPTNTPSTLLRSTILALALGLAACGGEEALETGSETPSEQTADDVVAVPDEVEEDTVPDEDPTAPLDEDPDLGDGDFSFDPIVDLETVREAITGLPLDEAEAWAESKNMEIRIWQQDGEEFLVTMDLANWRINVIVDDGIVTTVTDIG